MDEFGVFAVGYSVLWILLGTNRVFVSEVNLILGRDKLDAIPSWRAFSATASLLFGLASGVVVFGSCQVLARSTDLWIPLAFASAAPFVMLADSLRYVSFSLDLPRDALRLDATWLAFAALTPLALTRLSMPPVPSAIFGWGLGAVVGAIVAMKLRAECRPKLRGVRNWFAARRIIGTQYAIDFLAASGIGQAAIALVPAVSSVAVAGGLRAGYVIIGPLNVVYSAIIIFLIPRIRNNLASTRMFPPPALAVSGGFIVVCVLYEAAVYYTPKPIGEALLGESWVSGQSAAPFLIAAFAAAVFAQIVVQIMRLRGFGTVIARIRVVVSLVQATAILIGAHFGGVIGASIGSAAGALAAVAPWWVVLNRTRCETAGQPTRRTAADRTHPMQSD